MDPDRLKATLGAVILHVLMGYALLHGLGFDPVRVASENLKVFDVPREIPPPPPEKPVPAKVRIDKPEGAAAPPSLPPTPVVAPKPKIVLPVTPPITAAPKTGTSSNNTPGTADVAGTGTGSGGSGNGTGSGGFGNGTGGGGVGMRAQRVRGALTNADYRLVARGSRPRGTVHVRFTVETNGSVTGCAVTRSSGHPELDTTTCRLIEQRFRYRPATDPGGRPVRDLVSSNFFWGPTP